MKTINTKETKPNRYEKNRKLKNENNEKLNKISNKTKLKNKIKKFPKTLFFWQLCATIIVLIDLVALAKIT